MLETLPPLARFVFRGNPAALGVPATPLRATRQGERIALWQRPDEWLLLQPEATPAPQVMAGALVDVSHRQIALALHGVEAEIRLNAACPLDLSEAAFPVEAVVITFSLSSRAFATTMALARSLKEALGLRPSSLM